MRTWLFGILYRKLAETRCGLQRDGGADDVMESRFAADGTWVRNRLRECLETFGLKG